MNFRCTIRCRHWEIFWVRSCDRILKENPIFLQLQSHVALSILEVCHMWAWSWFFFSKTALTLFHLVLQNKTESRWVQFCRILDFFPFFSGEKGDTALKCSYSIQFVGKYFRKKSRLQPVCKISRTHRHVVLTWAVRTLRFFFLFFSILFFLIVEFFVADQFIFFFLFRYFQISYNPLQYY